MHSPSISGSILSQPAVGHVDSETKDIDKALEAGQTPVVDDKHPVDKSDRDNCAVSFTPGAQTGVQKMEATTTVWGKKSLIAAYVMMWIIAFVDALQQGASYAFVTYVTSDFKKHSLTAYTTVMSGIVGGVLRLPLAKILDIFGRPQGFALTAFFLVIGLASMAACNSVEVYAVAQIFYWVGYNGVSYVINVFPKRLAKYLPAETQPDLMLIYNDISKQTSYPKGSPTRIAIEAAYGDAQMYMAIVATAVLVLALGAVLMWRDIKVKEFKQVKGRVV